MAIYRLRLIAGLRALAGAKMITIVSEAERMTLHDLLRALRQDYPLLAARVLDDEGNPSPDVLLLVDGQPAYALAGPETPLAGESEVTIVPVLSGG